MYSRFLRTVLFSLAALCVFLALPIANASAAVCCHCYFDARPASERTQCIQFAQATSCDADVISGVQRIGDPSDPSLLRLFASRTDLAFRCDASPVSSALCRAGTGAAGDRCPSRPPIAFSRASLEATFPTAPTPGSSGGQTASNATTNATNDTNASADRGSSRQARARDYNRNFPNPLPGLTVQKTIGGIIRIIVGLVGILFLVVFIWGSFLYMTSAGDPKQVQSGKDAIRNAVIGLAIVMVSYTAVSVVIQTAGNLMGATVAPTVSQEEGSVSSGSNATNNTTGGTTGGTTSSGTTEALQCGCTCVDGNMQFAPITGTCTPTSCRTTCDTLCAGEHRGVREATCDDTGAGASGGATPGGSSTDACARYYAGPVENCFRSGGQCPTGVNNMDDLLRVWGPRLPGGNVPASQEACRSCIATEVESLAVRFPGLDMTCVPALASSWNSSRCSGACNSGGGTDTGPDICTAAAYNNDASCRSCIEHVITVLNASRTSPEAVEILRGGCPTDGGKAVVWCATGHPGWSAPGSICSFR